VTTIIDDVDVRARLRARDAVHWMGEAIDAHHRGEFVAPPRVHAQLGDGRMVFTAGELRGSWFGYRSYDTLDLDPGSQVVVVHDATTGVVRVIAMGNELGPRRTGAIGAVAADALAAPSADVAAVIGTGTQASAQLWALRTVRELREVRVFSRDKVHRDAFAHLTAEQLGLACHSVKSARAALEGASIVILATSSPTPVIKASWLARGAYVATLGPKQRARAEFGLDLAEAAALLVTDSTQQMDAYDPPNLLAATPFRDRMVSLGALRAGEVPRPEPGGISVFFSVGLAGTEAFLAERLASTMH